MRCPICDFNTDDPEQSLFYSGLQLPGYRRPRMNELGEVVCDCYHSKYDDGLVDFDPDDEDVI